MRNNKKLLPNQTGYEKKKNNQKLWVTNLMRKMVPKFPPFSRQGDNNNRADGILSQKGPRPTKCSTEKW